MFQATRNKPKIYTPCTVVAEINGGVEYFSGLEDAPRSSYQATTIKMNAQECRILTATCMYA